MLLYYTFKSYKNADSDLGISKCSHERIFNFLESCTNIFVNINPPAFYLEQPTFTEMINFMSFLLNRVSKHNLFVSKDIEGVAKYWIMHRVPYSHNECSMTSENLDSAWTETLNWIISKWISRKQFVMSSKKSFKIIAHHARSFTFLLYFHPLINHPAPDSLFSDFYILVNNFWCTLWNEMMELFICRSVHCQFFSDLF